MRPIGDCPCHALRPGSLPNFPDVLPSLQGEGHTRRALRGIRLFAVLSVLPLGTMLPAAETQAQLLGRRTDLNTGSTPRSVAIADVDEDGFPDVLVTVQGAGVVSIFPGNGDLTFRPRIDIPVRPQPIALAVADWTGDGNLDLLVGAAGDTTLTVHVGDGAGGFSTGPSIHCPAIPYEIEVADVTGDGWLDAVIAADELTVALFDVPGAPGGGLGVPRTWIAAGSDRSRSIELAQIDELNGPDIYFASTQGAAQVLFSDGAGGFSPPVPVTGSAASSGIALGDVTGDGRLDVLEVTAHAGGSAGSWRLLRGLAGGEFVSYTSGALGAAPLAPVLGDFNLDGFVDFATVHSTGSYLGVSLGSCTFQPQLVGSVDSDPVDLVTADIDLDGDADFVTANLGGASVSVRRNDRGTPEPCEAILEVSPASVDFGELPKDYVNSASVLLRNVGYETLFLTNLSVGTASFSVNQPASMQIPEGGSMQVLLNALRPELGPAEDTLRVTTTSPFTPQAAIPLSSRARVGGPPAVLLAPAELTWPLGPQLVPEDKTITVTNAGEQTLTLEAPTSNTAEFTNVTPVPLSVPPGQSRPFVVRYLRSTLGAALDTLRLASNDPARPTVEIRLTGQARLSSPPTALLVPAELTWPLGIHLEPEDRTITVTNAGEQTLTLEAPTFNTAEFTNVTPVPLSVPGGESRPFVVRYLRSTLGSALDTLRLASNDPAWPSIEIRLSGFARERTPIPLLNPVSRNYGAAPVHYMGEAAIQIKNLGDAPYTVLSVDSSSPQFQLEGPAPPFVVAAGATVFRIVNYLRSEVGSHSGVVTFTIDVPEAPTLSLALTGETTVLTTYAELDVSELDFGTSASGNPTTRTVYIHAVGTGDLDVLSAVTTNPDIQVLTALPKTLATSWYQEIEVRWNRTTPDTLADTLVISTSSFPNPVRRVALSGIALRPPIAVVETDAIPLVELPFGAADTRHVVVRNDGDQWPLAITASVAVDSIVADGAASPLAGWAPGDAPDGGPVAPLPQFRLDAEAHAWDVQADGSIAVGDPAAFTDGLEWTGFPAQAQAALADGGRTIVLGPVTSGDLEFTRRVHVSPSEAWARWLDTVHNSGTVPRTYRIPIRSAMDVALPRASFTSSGDGSMQPADDWVVVEDDATPAIAHVIAGPGGLRPVLVSIGAGLKVVRYEFEFTLAPGATASILHFAVQAPTRALAIERAEALRTPYGAPLFGLSSTDRARVLNFELASPFSLPVAALGIPPLGSAPLSIGYDGSTGSGEETSYGTLRIATDDPLRPLFVIDLSVHVGAGEGVVLDGSEPGDGPALALAARFVPNPAIGRGLRLSYALPAAGEARFELYDVRGRRIDARVLPAAAAGRGTLDWSGGAGAPGGIALAPGVYWTRLTHGGRSVVTKGVVLR